MHEPKPTKLPLFALASIAALPFVSVVALGAMNVTGCGGGGGPATSPTNASSSASVTAPATTSAAPTDTGSTATTSTGPASAMPTASQPSSITSKKTMRKKNPEWLVCHKDYQPQRHDIVADLKKEGSLCQDATGMHAVGDPHVFKGKKDSDLPDSFAFHAKMGKCYRAFAESGQGIDDLDLVIKDSDRNVAGEDSTDDPSPIVLEDGAVCFNAEDDATVSATIGSGHGDYAVQLWSDE